MDRILLIGERFSDNLGDGLLCEIVTMLLKEQFGDIDVLMMDMSLRTDYPPCEAPRFDEISVLKKELSFIRTKLESVLPSRMQSFNRRAEKRFSVYPEKLKQTIEEYQPSAIVFAGGQMLMETFVSRVEQTVALAQEYGIPVYFNACGCGNKMSQSLKNRLENVLQNSIVKKVSVRDGYDLIVGLAGSNKVIDVLDTALIAAERYPCGNTKRKVGYGIMFSRHHDAVAQVLFWRRLIKYSLANNVDFQLFCNGSGLDHAFAEYILKTLNLDPCHYLAQKPCKPDKLVELISGYQAIVSMRLHSLIVAYSSKVPAVAIAWDDKIREFYRKTGMKQYCFDLNCDAKTIVNAIGSVNSDPEVFGLRDVLVNDAKANISRLFADNG